ncbi:MAG: thiamine-phosphate kinase [Bacteroidales bacterium]|nr:thiamine-phosphate kinase [Bacteroidales bacterium]
MEKTPISKLGEFKLIEHLTKDTPHFHKETLKGIGDDAAVISVSKGKKILVTTDLLVEGIHFNLVYTPLKHLGYKAVAVNLSDIAAMNGTPKQITVSIAISSKFSVESLEELYAGIYAACNKYNVDLIGGDTTSSLTGMLISITAIGEASEDEIVYRNGAKIDDMICVSGDLGASYLGLQLLEREYKMFKDNPKVQPDFSGKDYLLQRQLKPEPRFDILKIFKEAGIKPNSMIDISDGLSSELNHICKQSNVGAKIYNHKIPIDAITALTAEEFNMSPETAALHGGEDYELLFTVSPEHLNKLLNIKDISILGQITEAHEGIKLKLQGGSEVDLAAKGWLAFGEP